MSRPGRRTEPQPREQQRTNLPSLRAEHAALASEQASAERELLAQEALLRQDVGAMQQHLQQGLQQHLQQGLQQQLQQSLQQHLQQSLQLHLQQRLQQHLEQG